MIKKIFAIILIILAAFSITACNGESAKLTEPEGYYIVEHTEPALTYEVKTYLVDDWRNDLEDGSREYFVTLLTYSGDYIYEVNENDVKVLNENSESVSLVDEIEGAEVKVVNSKMETDGTNAYIKIKTNRLIDTKKLFVELNGKVSVSDETKTILTSISPSSTPNQTAVSSQIYEDTGMLRIHNDNSSLYYYDLSKNEITTDGDKHIVKIYLEQYKEDGLDVFASDAVGTTMDCFVEIEDDKMEYVWLDEDVSLFTYVDGNYVVVEFATLDGSSIEDEIDKIPSYLTCVSDKVVNFALK